jgi:hypothetical protein
LATTALTARMEERGSGQSVLAATARGSVVDEICAMGWKVLRRAVLFAVLLVLYLASTVPVGLFLYSLKTDSGVNIFKEGGFHAYMRCLGKSFP